MNKNTSRLDNVILHDASSGATAEIMVGMGCNCHRLQLMCAGQPVEVLWSVPDFATQGGHPCSSGIPLLFPFPGRIRGGVTHWKHRQYKLPAGDAEGNAIHGFVMDRPWRVVQTSSDRLVAEFHLARDTPQLLSCWPTDFRIQAEYTLSASALRMAFHVFNPSSEPLPCGLGLHPYFRVPLGPGDSGEDCLIQLPVAKTWELDQLIATGRKLELPDAAAYQAGRPYRELKLDALFTDLQFEKDQCTAAILDLQNRRRMRLQFQKPFQEIVVYTPENRQSICIEPWSCATDPLRMNEVGIDAGLSLIDPQNTLAYRAEISLQLL